MNITSKTIGKFVDIQVTLDNIKVDLGLFDKNELKEFLDDLQGDMNSLSDKLEHLEKVNI